MRALKLLLPGPGAPMITTTDGQNETLVWVPPIAAKGRVLIAGDSAVYAFTVK